MNDSIILGIESSCDETSVAVVKNGTSILSNVIYSQIEEHKPFGGVVPELASRSHMEKINAVYASALDKADLTMSQIDAIAVTTNPGLTGSLMIGANFAKSLALVFNKPVVTINHLEAHLYAPTLENYTFSYPCLGLLLSGGNSLIYQVMDISKIIKLADTLDDACGEAFDKAAALLDLGYPGGPMIEKKAVEYASQNNLPIQYNEQTSMFSRLLKNDPKNSLGFSFSGIKTAVRNAVNKNQDPGKIAYDFQNTVFELVLRNLIRASEMTGIRTIVASGGVLANQCLRTNLDDLAQKNQLNIIYPNDRVLCTDNAAMIAALGFHYFKKGHHSNLCFDVSSKSCLPSM